MGEPKRPEPKRRGPASRPGGPAKPRGTSRRAAPRQVKAVDEGGKPAEAGGDVADGEAPAAGGTIREIIAESAQQAAEQRFGSTARRAAILAAVVCVLTLTIAGPVRTYFAQRAEMKQLQAIEAQLHSQIADLEEQKVKLEDPQYIKSQARERLGFVMPGEIPYQVQLPPGAPIPGSPAEQAPEASSDDPWYTALWKTIADAPHGVSPAAPIPPGAPGAPGPVAPGAPEPVAPGAPPPAPDGPPPGG